MSKIENMRNKLIKVSKILNSNDDNTKLPNELIIALRIFIIINENKMVFFSNLCEDFEDEFNEEEIRSALDYLFDSGLITAEFIKIEDCWKRCFRIHGEVIHYFTKLEEKMENI